LKEPPPTEFQQADEQLPDDDNMQQISSAAMPVVQSPVLSNLQGQTNTFVQPQPPSPSYQASPQQSARGARTQSIPRTRTSTTSESERAERTETEKEWNQARNSESSSSTTGMFLGLCLF
jgi:hypothetical protein